MTKSYQIYELAMSLNLLATVKSLNCSYNLLCVSGSLLFFHKLKRRVELKKRKILDILKNHFGQCHKLK